MNLKIDIADPPSKQKDPNQATDNYFDCISTCQLDDSECEDSCTDQLKQDDSIHS
jgi:hypothetical protein